MMSRDLRDYCDNIDDFEFTPHGFTDNLTAIAQRELGIFRDHNPEGSFKEAQERARLAMAIIDADIGIDKEQSWDREALTSSSSNFGFTNDQSDMKIGSFRWTESDLSQVFMTGNCIGERDEAPQLMTGFVSAVSPTDSTVVRFCGSRVMWSKQYRFSPDKQPFKGLLKIDQFESPVSDEPGQTQHVQTYAYLLGTDKNLTQKPNALVVGTVNYRDPSIMAATFFEGEYFGRPNLFLILWPGEIDAESLKSSSDLHKGVKFDGDFVDQMVNSGQSLGELSVEGSTERVVQIPALQKIASPLRGILGLE